MAEKVRAYLWDLGRNIPYEEAWQLQKKLQRQRIEGHIPDTVLFLEHSPVYTVSRRSRQEDLLAPREFLLQQGIEVAATDRGGQITYHGPGQLVCYLIVHLRHHRPSVSWYVRTLEEVSIRVLARWGLLGERIEGLTGVWVKGAKITAIGVRMSRWVTMHGFAFNVSPCMEHYRWIVPCGIRDREVTSLAQLLDHPPSMEEVKKAFQEVLAEIFHWHWQEVGEEWRRYGAGMMELVREGVLRWQ